MPGTAKGSRPDRLAGEIPLLELRAGVGDELARYAIEKTGANAVGETLRLPEVGVPLAGAGGGHEAEFGHDTEEMPLAAWSS